MTWQRAGRTALLFLVLVAMQFAVRPLLQWRVLPDFLVVAVLLAAVRVRPGVAALVGFAVGLLADALTPATLGVGAFSLAVIGFAASWLKAVFFSDNVVLHAFFFFTGKWAFDILFVLMSRRGGFLEVVSQVGLWSPLAAALTALAGLLVLMVFRGMLEAPPG